MEFALNTAIILGAGASADFGLPLGSELYDSALHRLKNFRSQWYARADRDNFWNANRAINFINSDEFASLFSDHVINTFEDGQRGYDITGLFELVEIMETAPAYSLDTLALEYPESSDYLRILVANELINPIRSQISLDDDGKEVWAWRRRIIDDPYKPGKSIQNWIHLFCSMARNSVTKNPDQSFDIVSFNYDRVFEKVAGSIWEHPSRQVGAFDQLFTFHYPHGKIHWETGAGRSVISATESELIFAHNKPSYFRGDSVQDAIHQADILIFLGFHFSPENIETLALRNVRSNAQVIFQNFNDNKGLDRRVSELEFANCAKFTGSIASAILEGELGELPS